jgi:hypothetical protein
MIFESGCTEFHFRVALKDQSKFRLEGNLLAGIQNPFTSAFFMDLPYY